jgi:hypothetical protein
LRKEWGEEINKGALMNFLSKSEYLSAWSGLSYIVPIQVTFLDIGAVNFYSFISMQKMTSDFFVRQFCFQDKTWSSAQTMGQLH